MDIPQSIFSVHHGDALEWLKTLPDDSVDSLVCDPPSGIAFMNKAWDTDKGGRDNWIAWLAGILKEACRVLKPGGHGLVWAIPRTSHWTGMACEDAGFEVRDRLSHIFGCLSEDTEILTANGWSHYQKLEKGGLALCYNKDDDSYSFGEIEEVFVYEHSDTAYRVQSDHTDQIVTRNHRCLVEREGKISFVEAEDAAQELEARVPVLEDVQGLLKSFSMQEQESGDEEQNLFHDMHEDRIEPTKGKEEDSSYMRSMRKGVQAEESAGIFKGQDMQLQMPRSEESKFSRIPSKDEGGRLSRKRWMDRGKPRILLKENDWRKESCLEGRGDIQAIKGELQEGEACEMPAELFKHEHEERLCSGAPSDCREGDGTPIDSSGSRPSHGQKSSKQQARKSGAVLIAERSQALRASRVTRTTLARFSPFHYEGTVWCVSVPTGCFVARRNGKVFVTGNSGMPKSHNVSKAIDRKKGVERPVIGTKKLTGNAGTPTDEKGGTFVVGAPNTPTREIEVTGPGSEEAEEWDGFGSGLKPAIEDWWLVRKPMKQSIADNVLDHGTGALNLGGCVVEGEGGEPRSQDRRYQDSGSTNFAMTPGPRGGSPEGRWPPHLVLTHSELCDDRGCVFACPIYLIDEQSGIKTSGVSLGKAAYPGESVTGFMRGHSGPHNQHGGTGGASRFYPKFHYFPKPSKTEKEAGLEALPLKSAKKWNPGGIQKRRDEKAEAEIKKAEIAPKDVGTQGLDARGRTLIREDGTKTLVARFVAQHRANTHPTVKSIELMRWLCRLITPPGGKVIDPFTGSGTTGCAAVLEGFSFQGSELDADNEGYIDIAMKRMTFWSGFSKKGLPVKEILQIKRNEEKIEASGQDTLF